MKPEDLKVPFRWEERCILIKDRVWYLPNYYDHYNNFVFPGWNHHDVFGNDNPVYVEYCSGNGAWIAAKAMENPNINWVAVEKKFERAKKIWSKLKNSELNNLLVICGEAYKVTAHYFPPQTVNEIFINFPDPWPKTRHAKHRLIQQAFIQQLWSTLQIGHAVNIVTDDPDYSAQVIEEFHKHPGFVSSYPEPYYLTERENYGTSFFEEMWREKGKSIRYHRFQRSHES